MRLEKLFRLYLDQAKKLALSLSDIERTRACQWIKKIEQAPDQDDEAKALQLHSLKLLLLTLESNCLAGPFEAAPDGDKDFAQYNWNSIQLTDFSTMIRSKRDTLKRPEICYAVSSNRRELVTHQNDPNTGQHCYYACSEQPIEQWDNLQGGAVKNQSIDRWRERAGYEELNRAEYQNSSIDNPRCAMQSRSSEVNLNVNNRPCPERDRSHSQREPYSLGNNFNPGPSRNTNSYSSRPETPQAFGGRGQSRSYKNDQFGISQNEQFRSPRGVFQNLDYDSYRSPIPPRLTDEVIESFEKARPIRGPLSEIKQDDARQQLCARLQKIRDEMKKKPQVEIETQTEIQPKMIPHEWITLEEPCDDGYTCHQETDQDLGILSADEMDDEALFGEQQTADPRTVFKTRDNLVSRNVVKIETNTTINGGKREVIEEVLEKEDVDVVERSDEDENLEDVSEPEHFKPKPRRVLSDYSDLPQEDLEDVSRPSFQQGSFSQREQEGGSEYIPRESNRFYSGRGQENSERLENISQPMCPSSFENTPSRPFPEGQSSGRIDNIGQSASKSPACRCASQRPMVRLDTIDKLDEESQPSFVSSFKDSRVTSGLQHKGMQPWKGYTQAEESEKLDDISQPSFLHSTQVSDQGSRCRRSQKPFPQVNTSGRRHPIADTCRNSAGRGKRIMPEVDASERIDEVTQPKLVDSFQDSYQVLPRQGRNLPQIDTSEQLEEVSQPGFDYSTGMSYQDSSGRTNCLANRRTLPQVETSERLDEVSDPGFPSSIDKTYRSSTKRSCCPSSNQRSLPYVETSERLDQVSHPSFVSSFRDSTVPSRQGRVMSPHRHMPLVETDETCHDSINRSCCPSSDQRRKPYSQVKTSERLDQITPPSFMSSRPIPPQDTFLGSRDPTNRRAMLDTSEKLDQISQPAFLSSIEDTYQDSTGRHRCPVRQRAMPQVYTSENLDDISNPTFGASLQDSTSFTVPPRQGRMSTNRRMPSIETSERLDEVSHPALFHSTGISHRDSTRKNSCPTNRRALPQVETSERLDQVSHPRFLSSVGEDYEECRRKCDLSQRSQPQDELSKHSKSVRHSSTVKPPNQSNRMHRDIWGSQFNGPEVLDGICQPEYPSSFEDSTMRSKDRRKTSVDELEWLDNVSRPEYPSSFQTSSLKYDEVSRRIPKQKLLPQMDDSEELENICQPEFPSSFEDSYQASRKQTSTRKPIAQQNVSERLVDISQPFCPSSFEDSTQRSRDTKHGSMEGHEECNAGSEFPDKVCQTKNRRSLPLVEESEMLDAVLQPNLTSFEDTGYGSKDSFQQRILSQLEESERLQDISQPTFQSYRDSTLRSRDERRTQDGRALQFTEDSERLSKICQPELYNSFEISSRSGRETSQGQPVEYEQLENVCPPSFQSSFEESNQEKSMHRNTQREEAPQISRRSPQRPRQRLLSRVDNSEVLDDVSQPFYPTSIEDTVCDWESRQRSKHLRFPQVSESEDLDNITQPMLQSTIENSRHSQRKQTPQRMPWNEMGGNQPELNDISQPTFPTSFEDSMQSSGRHTKGRPLPIIDSSEKIEDVCHPSFGYSIEESSSRPGEVLTRRPFPQVHESERLNDINQPSGLSYSLGTSTCKPYLEASKHEHVKYENRQQSRIDDSKATMDNKSRYQDSERLEDVCQPSFPRSLDDSSRRYNSQQSQKSRSRRVPIEFDTSELLDDQTQPEFHSTVQNNSNISRQRQRIALKEKVMLQIDPSENIDSVCEPEFPPSFSDSTRSETPNLSSTYRQAKGHKMSFPEERVVDISEPTFDSYCGQSSRKNRVDSYLTQENLEDISCPKFETTPKAPRCPHQKHVSGCPPRQLFPKQCSIRDRTERPGDFRQVFETLPNYAPFEQQVASERHANPCKHKAPANFGYTKPPLGKKVEVYPPSEQNQMANRPNKYTEDFCTRRMVQPPTTKVDPCTLQGRTEGNRMKSGHPAPTISSTRIPLPPSARCQANVQGAKQPSKLKPPANPERIVKKSSVKFHQTKSTYLKNAKDQSNRNQRRD